MAVTRAGFAPVLGRPLNKRDKEVWAGVRGIAAILCIDEGAFNKKQGFICR